MPPGLAAPLWFDWAQGKNPQGNAVHRLSDPVIRILQKLEAADNISFRPRTISKKMWRKIARTHRGHHNHRCYLGKASPGLDADLEFDK